MDIEFTSSPQFIESALEHLMASQVTPRDRVFIFGLSFNVKIRHKSGICTLEAVTHYQS